MSNSRDIMNRGSTDYFIPYVEAENIFIIHAGHIDQCVDISPTGPQINLAPDHQEYTPSHRKHNKRSKFKRQGR
jgi:hypothetical protein